MKPRWLLVCLLLWCTPVFSEERPNVVLVTIDDLNDWIGVLGGHPQAHTPHLDRLSERGVLFTNAHCQAPICGPSRASLMTGMRPTTTGIYDNPDRFRGTEATRDIVSLPQFMAAEGYATAGVGKLFHGNVKNEFEEKGPALGQGPMPKERFNMDETVSRTKLWDWGTYPEKEEEAHDLISARWAAEFLSRDHEEEPFFLGVGFYRPHVPLYAPERWMKRYPPEAVELPVVKPYKASDHVAAIIDNPGIAPSHSWFLETGNWKPAVAAYLACVELVDHCLGVVLDGLDASAHADNTWIFLSGDHGWHLGEKEHWAKRTLWEESTRVPMMVIPPAGEGDWIRGARSDLPVEMLSFYPTILDVCRLPENPENDGRSLRPLLGDPQNPDWKWPAITTHLKGNHAIRTQHWRYIRYATGEEELFDHRQDPDEWKNLADDPAMEEVISELSEWLPD